LFAGIHPAPDYSHAAISGTQEALPRMRRFPSGRSLFRFPFSFPGHRAEIARGPLELIPFPSRLPCDAVGAANNHIVVFCRSSYYGTGDKGILGRSMENSFFFGKTETAVHNGTVYLVIIVLSGMICLLVLIAMRQPRKTNGMNKMSANKLEDALVDCKRLSGLIPICSSCKKIRDDEGCWNKIESYIEKHSEAEFTHGICPECANKIFPE
jgi:hypothetical protein